jgi:hypothetical protein
VTQAPAARRHDIGSGQRRYKVARWHATTRHTTDHVRRVVPCGVKRLDGITYPPERRRAQEAAAAVTWRPKCNHVNMLHAAGATPLASVAPAKARRPADARPDKGHEQRTTRENHKVRVGGTNRKGAQRDRARPRSAQRASTAAGSTRKFRARGHNAVSRMRPPTRPRHTAHHS